MVARAHWEAMEQLYPPPRLDWPLPANPDDTDTRVKCVDCTGLRAGACVRPRDAGLCGSRPVEMGALKVMPQNCQGFLARAEMKEAA